MSIIYLMEYIQSKPNNIDVYVNEFHTRIKTEFEKSINKIYNEELSVYRQVIETVVKLPFIQEIIEENKTLKAKLKVLEEADNVVKLEIFDKPVSKILLDVETIPFSSESNSDASSDDDADDESSGDSSEDDDDDKPIVSTADTTTKPSADKEVMSLCKNQDCSPIRDTKFTEKCSICSGYFADDGSNDIYFLNENGGVGSCDLCKKTQNVCIMKGTGQCVCVNACDDDESDAEEDEEEDQSADDEEDQSPTFPVKIIVNKLDKEEDNLEEVEEEPSADQEVETETEEVEESEEEPSADKEEEPSADKEEEPSADKEEEEPSADKEEEEPSADTADEGDAEVIEIEIDGKTYYCESEENGNIYEDDNGEVGNIVGEIKDGEASFFE